MNRKNEIIAIGIIAFSILCIIVLWSSHEPAHNDNWLTAPQEGDKY